MSENKPNLDEILQSPQAAQLMKDKKAIMDLANSPEAKKLMQLIKQTGGGKLQDAAQAAMGGDTSALMEILGRAMKRPEGAKTVEDINRTINNK